MSRGLNFYSTSVLLDCFAHAELADLSDEALITRLRGGSSDALAILFNRYHRMVLSVSWRILHDAGEAEDLMQSVFLRIFRFADEFDPDRGNVKIWILQSAYNQAFNRRRYLTLRGIYCNVDDPAGARSSTYNRHFLYQSELAQAVKEALGELRKPQRQVVEYAFYEGLTMREIAQKTCKTFHSVRHDYYRALKKLRRILADSRSSDAHSELTCQNTRSSLSTQVSGFDNGGRSRSANSPRNQKMHKRTVPLAHAAFGEGAWLWRRPSKGSSDSI